MDFLVEYLHYILLGLEILLLNLFGKHETAEEKKQRLIEKQEKKLVKDLAKTEKDSAKLEEMKKKEV